MYFNIFFKIVHQKITKTSQFFKISIFSKKKSKFQKKIQIFQFSKNVIFFSKFSIFSNFDFFSKFSFFFENFHVFKIFIFFNIFHFFYIFLFWLQKFSVSIDFGADVDLIFNMISDILRFKLCYQYILKYVAYFVSSDLM